MLRVKNELKRLRKEKDEAVGKLSNDDSITSLKRQIEWFQHEALEFDKILESQKKEYQRVKTSAAITKGDNTFIRGQVKDALRHNKLLEVAVNKTNRQSEAIRVFLAKNKPKDEEVPTARAQPLGTIPE